MTDDLISLEDAIEAIASVDITDGTEPVFSGKQVIGLLKDLYTINPQKPKTGHWIDDNGIYAWCSCCKEHIYQTGEFKYCPNCGARMEGDDDDLQMDSPRG